MKETILIDMDKVLCDFEEAYKTGLRKEPGIIYPHSQYKFFENLKPIDGAVDAYFALKRKFHVYILSRPSIYNALSYTEKRIWVENHLGFEECLKLILCCDKTMVKGHYLIDDWEQKGLCDPEWKQIKFGSEKFPDWAVVLDFLLFQKRTY